MVSPTSAISPTSTPLLEVADLAVSFDNAGGPRIQAVCGVSMALHRQQTLAVLSFF